MVVQPRLFALICLALVADITGAEVENRVAHVDYSGEKPLVLAQVRDENGDEHEFRVPFYFADDQPAPKEIKDYEDALITKIIKPSKEILEAALIQGRSKLRLAPQLTGVAAKFLVWSIGFLITGRKFNKKYNRPNDEEFQQETIRILQEMIATAKDEMKRAGREDSIKYEDKEARQATGRRLSLILDGLKQLVLNSPVGIHLDYRNLTIDGKLMTEEVTEHIKFMNKTGLGWIIDLVNWQCGQILVEQKKVISMSDMSL